MVNTKSFFDYLIARRLEFFVGVPDSLLINLCACIDDNCKKNMNIISANEGNAIAIAAGYNLSTSNYGVVYMQNSGIGNSVNPLLSLADKEVYEIPMLLIVGWRGEPNKNDEPQHIKQGMVTLSLFETMGIESIVLEDSYENQIAYCIDHMKKQRKPIALIVRQGTFTPYTCSHKINPFHMSRELALEKILDSILDDDFLVSTTGKISREIYEIRERRHQTHSHDFLTVGSMGHASSLAFGVSLTSKRNIYSIDGDGAFLMHMGGLSIVAQHARSNYKYILLNNGAHESVGGQPTVAFEIQIDKILESFGFKNVYTAITIQQICESMAQLKNSNVLSALIVNISACSRQNLGRPLMSPIENKDFFMQSLQYEL